MRLDTTEVPLFLEHHTLQYGETSAAHAGCEIKYNSYNWNTIIKKTTVGCPGRAELNVKCDVVVPCITNVVDCREMGGDSKNKADLDYCHFGRR